MIVFKLQLFIYLGWVAYQLTRDQKPSEEDEMERIIHKGGRIFAFKGNSTVPCLFIIYIR